MPASGSHLWEKVETICGIDSVGKTLKLSVEYTPDVMANLGSCYVVTSR